MDGLSFFVPHFILFPKRVNGATKNKIEICFLQMLPDLSLQNGIFLHYRYVVKTLDNAESVKLQYRSLARVPNDAASKTITKKVAPNWL